MAPLLGGAYSANSIFRPFPRKSKRTQQYLVLGKKTALVVLAKSPSAQLAIGADATRPQGSARLLAGLRDDVPPDNALCLHARL